MPVLLVILALLAGYVACFSVSNLLTFRRDQKDRSAGYFGLMCLTFSVYALLQMAILSSESLGAVRSLLRVQGAVMALSLGLLVPFGVHFAQRPWDVMDRAIVGLYLGLALYSLASPSGYWFATLTSLETLEVPGGRLHHPHGTIAATYYVSIAVKYPLCFRQIRDGYRLFRNGQRLDGGLWALGMSVCLVAATHDHGIDFGWIAPPYLGVYGFPLLVLAMGIRYSFKRRVEHQETLRLKSLLAESEARLRDLFDSSADGILICDLANGAIVDVNRTAVKLCGYAPDEFRQLSLANLTADGVDDAQMRAQACLELAERKGEATFLWQAKRKDGTEFPAEVTFKLARVVGARCVVANIHDITERVAVAAALQHEQAFVATLLNGLPGAFFLYDRHLKLKRWNTNLEQSMGYAPEQLQDFHLGQWYPPGPQRDLMVAATESWLRTGQGDLTHEVPMVRADGSLVPYLITTTLLHTHEGPLFMGIGLDISGLVQAQTALRESEERYRALFESAGDAILLLLDGRFVDCNTQALGVYGCTRREELIGRTPFEFSPQSQPEGRDGTAMAEALVVAALTGQAQRFEWLHCRLDKAPFLAEVSLNAVDLHGVKHLQAIVRDVTEKNRHKERLRQSQRLEAIGQLAGGVAHDFNNLLTPILGNVELLLAYMNESDPNRADLEEVYEAALRAKRLTRQLLSFGRRAVMEVSAIDLAELLTGLERLLRGLLREDIELVLTLAEPDLCVDADPSQLEQVIMNLVVNARDAMPQGGRVCIDLERVELDGDACASLADVAPGTYARLTVADTGFGMSDEVKSRLFEPFFTTKAASMGTGLGLATVLGIVQQHRGAMTTSSEVGKGSTFRIYLPCAKTLMEPLHSISIPAKAEGGNECVLVVEDDKAVRLLTCQALQRGGYIAHEFESPEEALERFFGLSPRPNILLTDVVMPKMSGVQLYELLHAKDPQLHVLYMSGYAGDIIARHGIQDPLVVLLQKPFAINELLRKVRHVLGANGARA